MYASFMFALLGYDNWDTHNRGVSTVPLLLPSGIRSQT